MGTLNVRTATRYHLAPLVIIAYAGSVGLLVVAIGPIGSVMALFPPLIVLFANVRRVERIVLAVLGTLIVGYVFFNKAFAYVGVTPAYVGEVALFLCLIASIGMNRKRRINVPIAFLFGLIALGLVRTIPFLPEFGLDAFRDSALYYYMAFAIFVFLFVSRDSLLAAIDRIGVAIPFFCVWALVTAFFSDVLRQIPLTPPGSPVNLFWSKPGDRGVLLGVAASFALLGLYKKKQPTPLMLLLWVSWLGAFLATTIASRSGFLSAFVAISMVLLLFPSKRVLQPVIVGGVGLTVLILVNPTVQVSGYREFSVQQLTRNVVSIVSDDVENEGGVQQTKNWRQEFWSAVWDDTVKGSNFWTGRGFGVNLASDMGFQVLTGASLRSPHSAHMTFLAREGVPGFVGWILFNIVFFFYMVRACISAKGNNEPELARIIAWFLSIWAACLVNASFDVYLEGPQGAVLFWISVGAGLALASDYVSRHQGRDAKPLIKQPA